MKAAYQRMLSQGRAEVELLGVRKDGSVFWKQIVMVKAHDQQGQWIGHYCFMKDITERKRAEEALRDSAERLQVLSRRVVEVQEQERRHIARELHDEIGQVLSAISVNLHIVKTVCDVAARSRIEESLEIVDQATQQVRNLSLNLRPSMLDDLGLAATLRWLVDPPGRTGGPGSSLRRPVVGGAFAPECSDRCFRVAQEALNNVVRHARAKSVWVDLRQGDDEVDLAIRDDGVGFDPETARRRAARGESFGLLGIQERVELLGGRADIRSQAGSRYQYPRLVPHRVSNTGARLKGRNLAMTGPIRVLLADDHQLFRAGIRSLMQTIDGVEIVAEASNGREALDLCKSHRADVVLMDIMMPQLNGLDATARLAAISPQTRTIILSMNANEEYVLQAFRCGAAGYLLKNISPSELEQAIRAVARGDTYLGAAISKHVVTAYLQRVGGESVSQFDRLTPRQREVLQLVAEGYTTKEIARKLNLSVKTVEMHRSQLMAALDIHDIAGLVRYAIRMGLIDQSVPG